MKIHRFLIKENLENINETMITNPSLSHQLNNVLRLASNSEVVLLDGRGGEFLAKIKSFTKDSVSFFDIKENLNMRSLPNLKIKLAPAILKKDKFEWVVQKTTEIGVMEFYPALSERTEKNNLNIDRLEKIILEAFEQSEKTILPKLHSIKNLEEIILENENVEKVYLEIDAPKIFLNVLKNKKEVLIFVGPEGGWGNSDKEIFKKYGVEAVSIGDVVLRAETASISISSLMLLG